MAKKKVDVNALLGNLLTNLDKGVALEDAGKEKKKKKEKTLMDEAIATPRLNKPSLKTTRLVLIVNTTVCMCCGREHRHVNKHVLCEKVDKHGNKLQTRFIDEEDLQAPREMVEHTSTVANCEECFLEGEIKTVVSQDALDSIEPVSEGEVDALLEAVFGEKK
jgi:hypothetical protein